MKRVGHSFFFMLAIYSLLACTNHHKAPVEEVGLQSRPQSEPGSRYVENISLVTTAATIVKGSHQVSSGETLIEIAFAYNIDYTALARVNGIDSPYVIYPGQLLELDTSRAPPQTVPTNRAKKSNNNSKIRSTDSNSETATLHWAWPGTGKVIGTYSSAGIENKGIDIAGTKGDAVLAAEAGEVVYAGSGLLRYGDLLIIRHNAQYLSAYAHNSKLLVSEGDKVSRGQSIATLGSTGIDRDMLHFEIRQNGKPVDPLQFLPPR